jgi:hypothetical protein
MRSASAFAATLFASITLAGVSAQAATYTVTYAGHVADRVNLTNMFGAGEYAGMAYTLVYTINDAAPGAVSSTSTGFSSIGGPGAVQAALTLNGVTHTINGSKSSLAETTNGIHADGQPYSGSVDKTFQSSIELSDTATYYHSYSAETYISSYLHDFIANGDFRTPFTFSPSGTDSVLSGVQFNDYDWVARRQDNYAWFNLAVGSVTVARVDAGAGPGAGVGGVPEPGVWALMLLGFGAAGASLRRKRLAAL